MSYSLITYQGTGTNGPFAVNFTLGYLSKADVKAYVNGEVDAQGNQLYRSITWINNGMVSVSGAPIAVGQVLNLRRTTVVSALVHDYQDGSVIQENNLDESNKQCLMVAQEAVDFTTEQYASNKPDKDAAVAAAAAALASQNAAAGSASSAGTSASTATTKASEASASATSAATSANTSSTKATEAAGSASSASTSASTATAKAAAASTSETNAAASATSASNSASTATTKASEASASASTASAKAVEASNTAAQITNFAALLNTPDWGFITGATPDYLDYGGLNV